MAQKYCSFCCCSFCTLPSPNSPQQSSQQQQQLPPFSSPPPPQTITLAHSSPSSPPQSSQHQTIIYGHSSSSSPSQPDPTHSPQQSSQQPISSPPQQQTIAPQHQTITAHSSSSSPSSPPQSSQHQTIITAHTSSSSPSQPDPTPTMTEFRKFLHKFNDITQINTLIQLLEKLLKIASGEKSDDAGSNSAAGSNIQDGQRMLEMLNTHIGKRPVKNNSGDSTVEEIKNVCIEVLKGSEKIPKVGIALCMLGSVLERFSNISRNRKECLEVLKRIVHLGKLILKLNEQIPDEKEKLEEGVNHIIVGTIMSVSQLARPAFFSFFTATVNKASLNDFQLKVDRYIQLLTSAYIVGIADRLPNTASESQEIYGNEPTVGIEDAQKRVMELLDLNAQDTKSIVVVVHGFGGIGKTTLADAVYAQLNLQSYKHCRVHMEQDCTKGDLKALQQHILNGLFSENIQLKDCDEGQGRLRSLFKNSSDKPLFLYIDNGLKNTDLEQLLPKRLDSCLPPKSRILVTTRNLNETAIFTGRNIVHREYPVNPLPDAEARKLLLERVSEYNDEDNIVKLLNLCGGVPLLLELAGSQLALNKTNYKKNIVLELLNEGEQVKERDISDRMVDFVYDRLLPPVQQAFLDITSFFFKWHSEKVAGIVGEEEFRGLEDASFVKTSEDGSVIVHDIVRARGKKLSEGNRIRDVNSLSECLEDDEKLKKLRGIYFDLYEEYEQPAIEINCHHLNCMSDSLRVLSYEGSQITFRDKCQKPFQQLIYLRIDGDVVSDLPMTKLEKAEHLVYYRGPFTQYMNLYEFPPSMRFMNIRYYSKNRVRYSKIPPKVNAPSSLVEVELNNCENMQRSLDGVEKLIKLEKLKWNCDQLRELPSKLTDLSDLRRLKLYLCKELKELPSDFGKLQNLQVLDLSSSGLTELPSDFGKLQNLENLDLSNCSGLTELPSDFGKLQNLEYLDLSNCSMLEKLPSDFGQLQNLERLNLSSSGLTELPSDFGKLQNLKWLRLSGSGLTELPSDFGKLQNLKGLYLSNCSGLTELPSDFGKLQNLEVLNLSNCSGLTELPSDFGKLQNLEYLDLSNCSMLEKLPSDFGNCQIVLC